MESPLIDKEPQLPFSGQLDPFLTQVIDLVDAVADAWSEVPVNIIENHSHLVLGLEGIRIRLSKHTAEELETEQEIMKRIFWNDLSLGRINAGKLHRLGIPTDFSPEIDVVVPKIISKGLSEWGGSIQHPIIRSYRSIQQALILLCENSNRGSVATVEIIGNDREGESTAVLGSKILDIYDEVNNRPQVDRNSIELTKWQSWNGSEFIFQRQFLRS